MPFTTIFASIKVNELNYLKSLLESCGIQAAIWDETIGQLAPHYLFGQGGPRLVVPEEQAKEAEKIIKEYLENGGSTHV